MRWFAHFLWVAVSLSALASSPVARAQEAESAAADADEARRARVFARYGEGQTLTVGEIEDAIAAQSPFMRERYAEPAALLDFARGLVRADLMAEAARARGYAERRAVTRATSQAAAQLLIQDRTAEITQRSIPSEEVAAYFEAHQEEFQRPDLVRASHILLRTREEAEALLDQARAADLRGFRALVQEHSVDPITRMSDGDLRYFSRDGRPHGARESDPPVIPSIVEAAFSLAHLGDVSEPVPADAGFSLVKLTGRRRGADVTLEAADPDIRLILWRQAREQTIDALVEALRARVAITRDDRLVDKITLDEAPIVRPPAPGRRAP